MTISNGKICAVIKSTLYCEAIDGRMAVVCDNALGLRLLANRLCEDCCQKYPKGGATTSMFCVWLTHIHVFPIRVRHRFVGKSLRKERGRRNEHVFCCNVTLSLIFLITVFVIPSSSGTLAVSVLHLARESARRTCCKF